MLQKCYENVTFAFVICCWFASGILSEPQINREETDSLIIVRLKVH
jgi:hypothetical protein